MSPTSTTSYTVTYTSSGCAPATSTGSISVLPSPTVSVSNQTICAGSSATLQALGTPTGGTYTWSNNATGASITVAPTTTTTYTVTYTNNGCSATQSSVVTVNPVPTITATSATICAGGTATLSATANQQGGIFTWSTGVNGNSISISPSTTTNYTVYYTLNGCTSSPVTTQVLVSPAPTVSVNNVTICAGSAATLTATPSSSGGTYLWSNQATSQSITVSPATTTNYTVSYTISGCPQATSSGTISVLPSPIVNLGADTTICSLDFPFILTSAVSGTNNQYSWNTGDQTPSITITTGGNYSLTVTNTDGCSSLDSIQVFEDPCASLNEVLVSGLSIKPNPTQDFSKLSTTGLTITKISIYNAEGKFLEEINDLDKEVIIDLSSYSRGVYFIKALCKEGTLVRKLIKQ